MSAEQFPMHNNMQYEEDDESDEDDSPPPRADGARSEHIAGARRVKQRRKSHQKPEASARAPADFGHAHFCHRLKLSDCMRCIYRARIK